MLDWHQTDYLFVTPIILWIWGIKERPDEKALTLCNVWNVLVVATHYGGLLFCSPISIDRIRLFIHAFDVRHYPIIVNYKSFSALFSPVLHPATFWSLWIRQFKQEERMSAPNPVWIGRLKIAIMNHWCKKKTSSLRAPASLRTVCISAKQSSQQVHPLRYARTAKTTNNCSYLQEKR